MTDAAWNEHAQGDLRWLQLPRAPQRDAPLERAYWTGLEWQLGTAAYWEASAAAIAPAASHRLGETLAEEVGACLLGGHGMPFWLGQAAFQHLKSAGIFDPGTVPDAEEIEVLLRQPLWTRNSWRRYRFPRQRAIRLEQALKFVHQDVGRWTDHDLRNWLVGIPGIGPKTASWIIRNHRASDQVAIIDIHILRAGVVAGVFDEGWRLPRDYDLYEAAFVGWATNASLATSHLDACIWGTLAYDVHAAHEVLGLSQVGGPLRAVWHV